MSKQETRLEYCMSVLKNFHPTMAEESKAKNNDLTIKEAEKLFKEINQTKNIDERVKMVESIYNRVGSFLRSFAKMYAQNTIQLKYFEDALASLYQKIISNLHTNAINATMFANYKSFSAEMFLFIELQFKYTKKEASSKKCIKKGGVKKETIIVDEISFEGLDEETPEIVASEDIMLDETVKRQLAKRVNETASTLSPREAVVLFKFYGLNGYKKQTIEEIAKHYKLTTVRIYKVLNDALRKLKYPHRLDMLKDFHNNV